MITLDLSLPKGALLEAPGAVKDDLGGIRYSAQGLDTPRARAHIRSRLTTHLDTLRHGV